MRIVSGVVAALLIYLFLANQEVIVGRRIVFADEVQTVLLPLLVLAYSAAGVARLVALPPLLVVVADVLFASLLFHGYPQLYAAYVSVRVPFAALTAAVAASSLQLTNKPVQAVLSTAALLVAGFASYSLFEGLEPLLGFSLSLPSFALFAILAATSLASAFEGEVFEWIRSERAFLISLLVLFTAYELAKPYLANRPGFLDFAEWFIV
ncbi:MAG: hypothetical protein ABWW66_03925, partial [Archaeoglobaceae archaeon]